MPSNILFYLFWVCLVVIITIFIAWLFTKKMPLPLKRVGEKGISLDYRDNPLWYQAIEEIHTRGVTIKILFTGKANPECGYRYLEEAAKNGLIDLFYTDISPKRDFIVTDRRAVWLESQSGLESSGMYTFGPSRLADHLEEEFKQGLKSAHKVMPRKAEQFFSLVRTRAVPERIVNYLNNS